MIIYDSSDSEDIFETVNFLKNEMPHIKILILTPDSDNDRELKMLDNDINGIISYEEHNVNIPLAVYSIMKGDLWYKRDVLNKYIKHKNSRVEVKINRGSKTMDLFSLKEKHIIAYASQGYTNKDIGIKLKISEITVKNYLYRIYKKLNINNRKQLRGYKILS